jgi:uncharacterized phage protein gp47/JayE
MAEETTMTPDQQPMQQPAEAPTQETQANPEEQVIAQVIQLIAGLSAESQRQLMGFLNKEFTNVVSEEEAERKASPEEQERKAEAMSEMF